MARRCEVTGKGTTSGKSIARRGLPKKKGGVGLKTTGHTKRTFKSNIQKVRVLLPNGTVRRALGADGKPVRLRITKDSPGQKRAQTVLDNITKYANDAVKNAALSGKPMAIADARLQSAQLMGLPVAADKQGHRIVNVNGQWIPL